MKLRYTLPALADLAAILDYIAAHSPQGARRVQGRLQTLTELLCDILRSAGGLPIQQSAVY